MAAPLPQSQPPPPTPECVDVFTNVSSLCICSDPDHNQCDDHTLQAARAKLQHLVNAHVSPEKDHDQIALDIKRCKTVPTAPANDNQLWFLPHWVEQHLENLEPKMREFVTGVLKTHSCIAEYTVSTSEETEERLQKDLLPPEIRESIYLLDPVVGGFILGLVEKQHRMDKELSCKNKLLVHVEYKNKTLTNFIIKFFVGICAFIVLIGLVCILGIIV